MATTTEFTVGANTKALFHMNGTLSSAAKIDDASTDDNDVTEISDPTSVNGFDAAANGAYDFDGTSYLVQDANFAGHEGADKLTVHTWVKTSTDNGTVSVVVCHDGTMKWGMFKIDGSGYAFFIRDEAGHNTGQSANIAEGNVEDGAYHLLTGVYDGTDIKIYLDGSVVGSPTAKTGDIEETSKSPISIGASSDASNFFTGTIDESLIENRAWTATEISNYYNDISLISRRNLTLLNIG